MMEYTIENNLEIMSGNSDNTKVEIHIHHPEMMALTWEGISDTIFEGKVGKTTIREWTKTDGFPVITLPNGIKATTRSLVDLWFMSRMGDEVELMLSDREFSKLSLTRQKTYLSGLLMRGGLTSEKEKAYIQAAQKTFIEIQRSQKRWLKKIRREISEKERPKWDQKGQELRKKVRVEVEQYKQSEAKVRGVNRIPKKDRKRRETNLRAKGKTRRPGR